MEKEKDPVCSMSVDPEHPGAVEKFQGKTYYFCSNKCKSMFDKNRDRFASNKVG